MIGDVGCFQHFSLFVRLIEMIHVKIWRGWKHHPCVNFDEVIVECFAAIRPIVVWTNTGCGKCIRICRSLEAYHGFQHDIRLISASNGINTPVKINNIWTAIECRCGKLFGLGNFLEPTQVSYLLTAFVISSDGICNFPQIALLKCTQIRNSVKTTANFSQDTKTLEEDCR